LHIFYFHASSNAFLSCRSSYVYLFRQCSVVALSLGRAAAPFFNDVQVPPDHFLTLKKTTLAEILSLAHLMPCAATCEHSVARLVTSGPVRRFLATSPAADQQPAFGVLEATEAKSHLPNFDLVRLLRGRFRRACAVFTSCLYLILLVCAHAVAGRTRTGRVGGRRHRDPEDHHARYVFPGQAASRRPNPDPGVEPPSFPQGAS
jgi:hypothetical protein